MVQSTLILEELCGGAVQERFDEALQKVLENAKDRDREWKKKRSIVIEVGLECKSEDRDSALLTINVNTKLVPQKGVSTSIGFAKQGGRMVVDDHWQIPLPDSGAVLVGIEHEQEERK